jgi:hypothetical protein
MRSFHGLLLHARLAGEQIPTKGLTDEPFCPIIMKKNQRCSSAAEAPQAGQDFSCHIGRSPD